MRKVARTSLPSDILKVMLYRNDQGVYIFEYDSVEDAAAIADRMVTSLAEAYLICRREFGVNSDDWYEIDDPIASCDPDRLAPIRTYGWGTNYLDWNRMEMLMEGRWVELVS